VKQKQSRQPGLAWMPGGWFADSRSDAGLGSCTLRLRLLALLSGPKAPSATLGVAVAADSIVVQTLIVCALNVATDSTGRFGTLYLVGILVVPTVWGFGLAATMSVASALAARKHRCPWHVAGRSETRSRLNCAICSMR
jgi:hypothetical protein